MCLCNYKGGAKCTALRHCKTVTKGLPTPPDSHFAYDYLRVHLYKDWLGIPITEHWACEFSQFLRNPLDSTISVLPSRRRYAFKNKKVAWFPDGSTLPIGHEDIEATTEKWRSEEGEERVRLWLAEAEKDLDKSSVGVDFKFDFTAPPDWKSEAEAKAAREREIRRGEIYAEQQRVMDEKKEERDRERKEHNAEIDRGNAEHDQAVAEMDAEMDELHALANAADEADEAFDRPEEVLRRVGNRVRERDLDPNDDGEDYGVDQEPEEDENSDMEINLGDE